VSYPAQATLVAIGDIYCTQQQVITPSGTKPIGEVNWAFTDMSRTSQAIPTWAIVCTIVGFFIVCAFSLFFLLVKEDRTEGWVQVVVQGPEFMHTAYVPVYNPQHVADYAARVNYARSLSAAAASASG
jgi:hypothetical protein